MPSFRDMVGYKIFAISTFLSAFLLFAIQPIAAKHLLPYFGGSSAVWATSLVFFTLILFIGYAYVYSVTSLRSRHQMAIHGTVVVLSMIATLSSIVYSGSLFPSLDWITHSTLTPSLRVLCALLLSIGIPYFLLSTTGPLLQYWYGVTSEKQPYKLYALSNTGSLLALLAYPFIIEPRIALPTEELLWGILFFVYALFVAIVTVSIRHIPPHVRASSKETGTLVAKLEWIFFAALPAFLLVATTTVLTQLISPVPLLWVVPLSLYLLTFILAFSGYGTSRYIALIVLIAAAGAYVYTPAKPQEIAPEVFSYLLVLFFACLLCHARLYAKRPEVPALPFFYLCTSLGGVIGTMLASIAAPLLLDNFYEFPIGLFAVSSVAIVFLSSDFYPRFIHERLIRMVRVITPFVFLVLLGNIMFASASIKILPSRNFYGAVQLRFEEQATLLENGTTLHGLQPTNREWSYMPTTYYTQGSGIGRAMRYERTAIKKPLSVGVIGLGTGTLASYCETNDVFKFYEINPDIERIARSYFSYLARCAGSSVTIGDGRVALESESASTLFDLIAVDAFTDDAIPSHLVTKEAVQLYVRHLNTQTGILAMHTSNRFLMLYPMILSIAREEGLSAMVVNNDGKEGYLGSASQWVLIAKNPRIFEDAAFVGITPWRAPTPLPAPWTDTYTSLYSVLKIPNPFTQ